MQKGSRRKCKCEPEWSGTDCSISVGGGGDNAAYGSDESGEGLPLAPSASNEGGGEHSSEALSDPSNDVGRATDDRAQQQQEQGGEEGGEGGYGEESGGGTPKGAYDGDDKRAGNRHGDDDDDGTNGDDDASSASFSSFSLLGGLKLPGPLGALPLDVQLKAVGGLVGLLLVCMLALCAKKRCSSSSSARASNAAASSSSATSKEANSGR